LRFRYRRGLQEIFAERRFDVGDELAKNGRWLTYRRGGLRLCRRCWRYRWPFSNCTRQETVT
jgi:hypothetical protein